MSTKRKAVIHSAGLTSTPTQRGKIQRTGNNSTGKGDNDDDILVSLAQGGALLKTSGSNNQGTQSNYKFTPFNADNRKLTRNEEVEWLTQLNRRFEILALARQTQEKAILTQMADIKIDEKSYKFELETVAKAYATVLAQQQAHIQELSNDNNITQLDLLELKRKNGILELQLQKISLDKKNNENDFQKYKLKYNTLADQYENAQNSIESLQEALDQAQQDNEDLTEQLTGDLDDDDDDDGTIRSKLEAQVKLLEKQLEVERQHYTQDGTKNKEILKKLNNETSDLLDDLTSKFDKRLQEALQDQEEQHQISMEDLAHNLNTQNEIQIKKLTTQLNSQKTLNNDLSITKTLLDEEITALRNDIIALGSANEGFIKENDTLKDELQFQVSQHSIDLNVYQDHIDELISLYHSKEYEFEELMSIKVSLAIEIAQYRELIQKEEERLDLQQNQQLLSSSSSSVSTRRSSRRKINMMGGDDDGDDGDGDDDDDEGFNNEEKHLKNNTTKFIKIATTKKNIKNSEKTTDLVQTGLSLDGRYVKFTNGSVKPINYNGYAIGSELETFDSGLYHFSDKNDQNNEDDEKSEEKCILLPNQQLIIFFQKALKKDIDLAQKNGHILYDLHEENLFDEEDVTDRRGQLCDRLGRVLFEFDFINKAHSHQKQQKQQKQKKQQEKKIEEKEEEEKFFDDDDDEDDENFENEKKKRKKVKATKKSTKSSTTTTTKSTRAKKSSSSAAAAAAEVTTATPRKKSTVSTRSKR